MKSHKHDLKNRCGVVYFIPAHKIDTDSLKQIFKHTKFLVNFPDQSKIGIKVHFGEDRNHNHLSPQYVKSIVDIVRANNLKPTLIETSTLYRGARQNRTSHIKLAFKHGFTENNVGAKIDIVDGMRGEKFAAVPTNFQYVKSAKIASGLDKYDGILNLAHYKGHFVVGFGGVIKNIAMGLAAKGGKLEMHSLTKPTVKKDKCDKCEACLSVCPVDAIEITEQSAVISKSCIGCASCIEVCPEGAIRINWNEASESTQKKMAEYTWAILHNRKSLHFNFALKITPNCDCMDRTEKQIMPDIGVFVSSDPVACEMAVWKQTQKNINKLYPELNPQLLMDYAQELGLGYKTYKISEI
jgi:uncharacterized Fe-S center protein